MRGVELFLDTGGAEIKIQTLLPHRSTKAAGFNALRRLLADAGTLVDAYEKSQGGTMTEKQFFSAMPQRATRCGIVFRYDATNKVREW